MSRYDYDLVVIGAGSGGVRAARMSASFGARVAVCEERDLGGTCVNIGCIPKKLFSYGAEYGIHLEDARGYGWDAPSVRFDWPTLREGKDRELRRLRGIYEKLLENAGCTILRGRARIAGLHAIEVDGRTVTAERILVATGSRPVRPGIPGAELAIVSDDAFALASLPSRAVVVGGGYIGVEFASLWRGLGVNVHLVQRWHQLLRDFDEDVRSCLMEELDKRGIEMHLSREVRSIERLEDGSLRVRLTDDQHIDADLVLFAIGRVPKTANLGLETVGVERDENGAILVDDAFRTNVPSIYAIGDVLDRVQLTPVALAEAMVLAKNLFGGGRETMRYDLVPTAVFSHPSVGTVGLTEAQARHQYPHVRIFRSSFRPLRHTVSGRAERAMLKVVVDADTDRVVGCHMVGADAGEIIQGLAVALRAGATKADFDATLGIHPTLAEEFVTMRSPVGD